MYPLVFSSPVPVGILLLPQSECGLQTEPSCMELLGFLKILEGHEALDSKFAYIVYHIHVYSCIYTHILAILQ